VQFTHLYNIHSPADLKGKSLKELKVYASELRAYITQCSIKNGGHLAPSLGAVELAIGLHYVLDAPKDNIFWDVGHQAYAHKLITGRVEGFKKLRSDDGISGFLKPTESEFDAFISGHASNALSAAAGLARAAKIKKEDKRTAVVIGDGALTGGMAFEALNDIGATGERVLIILNDNEMSISKNVGAMSGYFSKLRISKGYHRFKKRVRKIVSAVPFIGSGTMRLLDATKRAMSAAVGTNKMFEQLGIRYYGPYDGNDLGEVIKVLKQTANLSSPVLLHMQTQKGCGFKDAEDAPHAYHGLNPAGEIKEHCFSGVVGTTLTKLAKDNKNICAITAAMAHGTGLVGFSEAYPERYFDVGIAEQHAVTLASGLAKGGLKPFVAIYSSFLQRSYDQIIHDTAILNLPVTFLIDRAGVIGADGVTHQGTFDIGYLNSIPNLTILSPKDGEELKEMIEFAVDLNAPLAIRYPKSYKKNYGFCTKLEAGKWEEFPFGFGVNGEEVGEGRRSDKDCLACDQEENVLKDNVGQSDSVKNNNSPHSPHFSFASLNKNNPSPFILAVGSRMLDLATKTTGACIVNARSIKPLDTEFLDKLVAKNAHIITLEDGHLSGGFGQAVLSYINSTHPNFKGKITTLALSDNFIHTHNIQTAFNQNGLTVESLQKIINQKST